MISTREPSVVSELLARYQSAMRRFCAFPELRHALNSLHPDSELHLLAIGKDVGRMSETALDVLGHRLAGGYVLTKYGAYQSGDTRLKHREAGHPLPDENSLLHSREIVEWMTGLDTGSELLVLLSGGGSALFELPRDGVDLAGLFSLNWGLLRAGLGIAAMNSIRAEHSMLKAGGALDFCKCKRVKVFALSDVDGDDPRVIASGPFTPRVPDRRVEFRIIGNNLSFRLMLADELRHNGWEPILDQRFLSAGPDALMSEIVRLLNDERAKRRVVIMGGEIPIQVTGTGRGGRCTHLALSAAPLLSQYNEAVFLALATDGSDNLSGVAGAWVDQSSAARLEQMGTDIARTLLESDSYSKLEALGQVIKPGEFRANVNDVYMLVRSGS